VKSPPTLLAPHGPGSNGLIHYRGHGAHETEFRSNMFAMGERFAQLWSRRAGASAKWIAQFIVGVLEGLVTASSTVSLGMNPDLMYSANAVCRLSNCALAEHGMLARSRSRKSPWRRLRRVRLRVPARSCNVFRYLQRADRRPTGLSSAMRYETPPRDSSRPLAIMTEREQRDAGPIGYPRASRYCSCWLPGGQLRTAVSIAR